MSDDEMICSECEYYDVYKKHPEEGLCKQCYKERDLTVSQKVIDDIERVFCPQSESEKECLMTIAEEVLYIDVKPFSHNLITYSLISLEESEGYYPAKYNEVVKMFKLHHKGWRLIPE